MPRPSTPEDLPGYLKQPHQILTVDVSRVSQLPAALTGLASLLSAMPEGSVQSLSGSTITVVLPQSDEELAGTVASHARIWDAGKADVEKYHETGEIPKYPYSARDYARAEGIVLPWAVSA